MSLNVTKCHYIAYKEKNIWLLTQFLSSQNENYYFGNVTLIFIYAHKIVFCKKFSRKHKMDIYKCPFFKNPKNFCENVFVFLERESKVMNILIPYIYPRIYLTPYTHLQ